jgi:hypothetical protein
MVQAWHIESHVKGPERRAFQSLLNVLHVTTSNESGRGWRYFVNVPLPVTGAVAMVNCGRPLK